MNTTHNEIIELVRKNLPQVVLTERERKVMEYRFGINDNNTHTLEETGKLFGVTRERIRQIEMKVIDKIEHLL